MGVADSDCTAAAGGLLGGDTATGYGLSPAYDGLGVAGAGDGAGDSCSAVAGCRDGSVLVMSDEAANSTGGLGLLGD